jgi:hypothetical protein
LSCCEQSVSSVEEENVSGSNSRQHCTRAKSGAERPGFQFTAKPGINVDLEDPNNSSEYSELILTSETAEIIARETNRYTNKFLENTPNLKRRFRTHHWKETNRNEIMKLLAFFTYVQGFHQKLDNKSYFSRRKILETPIFLEEPG